MRRSDAHEFRQAYNAQAVVCADGSQLILDTGVVATPADAPSFAPTILGMEHGIGLAKVTTEWTLIALAYNCRRLHRLQQA